MARTTVKKSYLFGKFLCVLALLCLIAVGTGGCGFTGGYSNDSLYPSDVTSVYLEMFDNRTFRRGVEYDLTDALAKRIEAETPYKIISDSDRADTILTGQIVSIREQTLSVERETGLVLEKQVELRAVVSWENLRTGELLVDNQDVIASATYSEYQLQEFKYASRLVANNLAKKIVEAMENEW
jgi:hypothetical protein